MVSIFQIQSAIENEIVKLQHDNDYWGSDENISNERSILKAYEDVLKFDVEQDNDAMVYFNKACIIEIWQYHLDVIIPKLSI